ncbi:MAG: prolipoprotein diacylglyceryl transferase [Caulobacteraceae bacterium]|nr:prolipoprotein diacylglyceryl transferase [Caulobacter sp.]
MQFPTALKPVLVTIPLPGGRGLPIRWYALAYVAGILLGWRYGVGLVRDARVWAGRVRTATDRQVDDFVLWVTAGIILGGRIGYVLFYMAVQQPEQLRADPWMVFRTWEGGMSFHGGLIGVTLAILLFAWRNRIDILRLADLTAPCVPIGLFFGRCANFVNGELWGRPTSLPWGMVFPDAGPLPRHPSQLYEASLEGVALFLILRLATHRFKLLTRQGAVTGLFLLFYGVFRFALEWTREPDRGMPDYAFGLTQGMRLSIPLVLAGIALILWSRRPQALAAPAPVETDGAIPARVDDTPPEAPADAFSALDDEAASRDVLDPRDEPSASPRG